MSEKPRKFGPKSKDQPSAGKPCIACGEPLKAGDFTTLIALGPGDDLEAQRKCREGKFYNAVATEIHWTCATGEES